MDFETTIKAIRKLYNAAFGKLVDVTLTYKGTEYGVTKCWHLRCDARETFSESHTKAATDLLDMLRKELADKISTLEKQAIDYRKVLDAGSVN